MQARRGLEGDLVTYGRGEEPGEHGRGGTRVGRDTAGADLGAQAAFGDPFEPAFRVGARRDFNVKVDAGAELRGQPVDAIERGGPRFHRVDPRAMPRERVVQGGDRRRIVIHAVAHDGAQAPLGARGRERRERVGQLRQARGWHDEAAEHPRVIAGAGGLVFRHGRGHRAAGRREEARVVDDPGEQGGRAGALHPLTVAAAVSSVQYQ
jgi:hypothetical protein